MSLCSVMLPARYSHHPHDQESPDPAELVLVLALRQRGEGIGVHGLEYVCVGGKGDTIVARADEVEILAGVEEHPRRVQPVGGSLPIVGGGQ